MSEEKPLEPDASEDCSAAGLIHRIRIGTLDPKLLNKEDRQLCVEALLLESASPSWMAQFLKVTDRTIRRDMEEIRARNALSPDPALARQLIGEFVLFARIHRGNLMKLARNSSASVGERGQVEYYAYMILSDMVAKLQSLGYLPKSADALVVMERKENTEANQKVVELCAELDEVSKLVSEAEAAKLLEMKDLLSKEGDPDAHDEE